MRRVLRELFGPGAMERGWGGGDGQCEHWLMEAPIVTYRAAHKTDIAVVLTKTKHKKPQCKAATR